MIYKFILLADMYVVIALIVSVMSHLVLYNG